MPKYKRFAILWASLLVIIIELIVVIIIKNNITNDTIMIIIMSIFITAGIACVPYAILYKLIVEAHKRKIINSYEKICKMCGKNISNEINDEKICTMVGKRDCNECYSNDKCITLNSIKNNICKNCYKEINKEIEIWNT